MGASQRAKGRRGESEALAMLTSRDWTLGDLTAGVSTEDFFGTDPQGRITAIEVKNCKAITLYPWRKQARDNARKRKAAWLLVACIPGKAKTYYIEGTHYGPVIWRGKS